MRETELNTHAFSRRNFLKGATALGKAGVGSFNYENRLLCEENLQCPSFFIQERPDFTLHAPDFLLVTPKIWQEIAP